MLPWMRPLQAPHPLQVQALFQQVWGVGQRTAERWYSQGLRTLDDVRGRAEELHLTEQQRVGTAGGRLVGPVRA